MGAFLACVRARIVPTLNIIGCGRVGPTLARLWSTRKAFQISDVCDHTWAHAAAAVEFIGAGRAVETIATMRRADGWLITTPDDAIGECCAQLAQVGLLAVGDIVFHCSGALASDVLKAARNLGAEAASVHPLKTFGDPRRVPPSLTGVYCAAEGDPRALALLRPAFEALGAIVFEIDAHFKTIYHSGGVLVSNCFIALLEVGLRCYQKAGLDRDAALKVIAPLLRETLENALTLGPSAALTGPVARGDRALVADEIKALHDWDVAIARIYAQLGAVALELAAQRGKLSAQDVAAMAKLLSHGGDSLL